MNVKATFFVLGIILIFFAGSMLLPIPVSLYYRDGHWDIFLMVSSATFLAGGFLALLFRKHRKITFRDGFAIVTFGWIICSLIAMIPFVLTGEINNPADAFFEAMSGLTTTGATILMDIEAKSRSVLFWRSETQWLGGMGIIVMSVAILPLVGVGGTQLFQAEAPGTGLIGDRIYPRISDTAKALWGVYLLLTGLVFIMLMWAGLGFYDSIVHAFTTIATGGFSPYNRSIAAFENSYVHWIIIIFMFISAANYTFHFKLLAGRTFGYFKSEEFRFYLAFFGVAIITLMILNGKDYQNVWINLRDATFQVVAIGSSTGYVTRDYGAWPLVAQHVILLLMFIGGCAGSTAGGIKFARILLVLKHSLTQLFQIAHPKGVKALTIDQKSVSNTIIQRTLAFFTLYGILLIVLTLLLVGTGPDFISAFSAVVCCLSNIGPALGSVGPMENYAHITEGGKILLAFAMLVGRLEFFTVLVLFLPTFWRQ